MKFLHVAFAVGGVWFGQNNRKGLTHTRTVACREAVQFDVGGHKFTIQVEDIGKYQYSSLYQMTQTPEQEVQINRSGSLFKYIYMYLQHGQLPRGTDGNVMMDEQTLKELKTEADYFGLDTLSVECDSVSAPDFHSYIAIRDYINCVMEEHKYNERAFTDYYLSTVPPLAHALKCLWVPFCVVSKLFCHKEKLELTVSNVVAAPHMSAIYGSQNCTSDVTKLNSTILDKIINQLHGTSALKDLAPHLDLTLQPEELVIQQEGFVQEQRRVLQSLNDTGLIGKLVFVLNSTYTGGELEVTHNGHTEVVTDPHSWISMHGDCLYKINPLTSGTRATLVFDIYGEEKGLKKTDERICFQKYERIYRSRPDLVSSMRPPSVEQQSHIKTCLKVAMEHRDSIVLGLQHQYHYNDLHQLPTVDMLTGGDRVLYEMLTNSGDYEIKLISTTIHDAQSYEYIRRPTVALFSPHRMQTFTITVPSVDDSTEDTDAATVGDINEDVDIEGQVDNDNDNDNDYDNDCDRDNDYDHDYAYAYAVENEYKTEPTEGVAVVMPSLINSEWILYDEFVDEGHDHSRESVYLVSGLQISKKKT